jgi:hypothetical protein
VSSAAGIAAVEAEVIYYRDSVALLRARLYKRGVVTTPRLEELQRRLDSAERRLRVARAASPASPQP